MSRAQQAPPKVTNRLRAVLLHVPYFSTDGFARLAAKCGVARSTISRIIREKSSPTYQLAHRITQVISDHHSGVLDMRELFTTDGTYPTDSVCALMDCKGCFPPEAWNEASNTLKPSWRGKNPGDWCRTTRQEPQTTQKPEESPASKQESYTPVVYL